MGGTGTIAQEWTTAFPDWRFALLDLIAEGDRVVAHMPYSGTHRAAIVGVEPTGRSCTVDEIVIFRIAEGRIVEAWEVYDEAGMWRHRVNRTIQGLPTALVRERPQHVPKLEAAQPSSAVSRT